MIPMEIAKNLKIGDIVFSEFIFYRDKPLIVCGELDEGERQIMVKEIVKREQHKLYPTDSFKTLLYHIDNMYIPSEEELTKYSECIPSINKNYSHYRLESIE